MAGLDDKQWNDVQTRLIMIDNIANQMKHVMDDLEDTKLCVNKIQVSIAEINVALFGVNRNNGMNMQVKKNINDIEEIKKSIQEKPQKTSKKIRSWIPVIICVLLFLSGFYRDVVTSIVKNVQQQTTSVQPNPTP